MKHSVARAIAESLIVQMRPYCERVEIAGSLRRLRPEVKDIELVAIPRFEERPAPGSLFEETTERVNLLAEWCDTKAKITWNKRGDRYRQGVTLAMGATVDLFICTPENWGYIFLLRTGCAEFSEAVVTHAKRRGTPFEGGRLMIRGIPVETREELDVFRLLELKYVAPEHRTSRRALRTAPRPQPERVQLHLLCGVHECSAPATHKLKNLGDLSNMPLCENHANEICKRLEEKALESPEFQAAITAFAKAIWNGENESPALQREPRKGVL